MVVTLPLLENRKRIQVFEPEEELKFGWLPHYHCCRTERGTNCSDGLEWVSAGAIAKLSMFALKRIITRYLYYFDHSVSIAYKKTRICFKPSYLEQ